MLKSYLKNSKLEVMPKITVGENLESIILPLLD